MHSVTKAEFEAAFPDNRFIDLMTPFHEAVGENELGHFRDLDHVNPAGALILSRQLADDLSREIQ